MLASTRLPVGAGRARGAVGRAAEATGTTVATDPGRSVRPIGARHANAVEATTPTIAGCPRHPTVPAVAAAPAAPGPAGSPTRTRGTAGTAVDSVAAVTATASPSRTDA